MKSTFSVGTACAEASVGRTTLYAEIKKGNLIARKIGRRTVILKSDLDAWLSSLPTRPDQKQEKH